MSENEKAPQSRTQIGKRVQRALAVIVGVVVVGMIVLSTLPKPIAVEVDGVARGPLEVTVDEDGVTRVKDRYLVSAPLSGNLGRVELDPGDEVEAGNVVARLVPLQAPMLDERSRLQAEARLDQARAAARQARASVSRSNAAFEFATSERERQEALEGSGGTPGQAADRARYEERSAREALSSARFGLRVAEHEVELAEAALGRFAERSGRGTQGPKDEEVLEVSAPVAGRVLRVLQESEGVVQPGTPLLEVGDPAALEIVVDVLTTDAVQIAAGAPVEIVRWGGEGALAAHVRRVEPSAFTKVRALGVEEQRVNVIIDLDAERESWAALGDGFRVEARIQLWRTEETLKVPASALFREGEGWAVFIVDGGANEGTARVRPVTLGRRNGFEAEVTDGLAAGDRVIVHPGDALADGSDVTWR
ncbi:MAG: HlyD family efflux transporter periplasmic adaptor subunit [Myxococcota bacterium]